MPWEGNGDSVRKLLRNDPVAQRTVILRYFPPGDASVPHRWYHRTVRETFLFLWGSYPGWEFAAPDDTQGRVEPYGAGAFMDRPPYSLHGRRPAASAVGSEFLQWHSHGGNFDADADESLALPFGSDAPPGVTFRGPVIVQTDALPWQPHPALPGALIRTVSAHEDGAPVGHYPIVQVSLPRGWTPPADMRIVALGGRPWLFVLWGGIDLIAGGVTYGARRGGYLDWQAPGAVALAPTLVAAEGCTVLCVGHTLSPVLALT